MTEFDKLKNELTIDEAVQLILNAGYCNKCIYVNNDCENGQNIIQCEDGIAKFLNQRLR